MVYLFEFFAAAGRRDALFVLVAVVLMLICLRPAASAEQAGGGLLGGQPADAVYDVRYLLRQAEQGDARAAFLLGTRFASGRGAARDDSEAFRWFEKAAEAGLAEAQYNLGVMYASGRGVVRNMAAAARWYEEAANQGIAEAQFNIGTLYALGAGVDKDEVRAAEWLRRAANKSLPQAQFNLGVLHEHGRGVRLDARMAMAWYRRAGEQGYQPATQRLEALEAKFDLVEVAPSSGPSPATDAASKVEGHTATEWLAALDPQHYTLQLLSDKDEGSVKRFVADHLDRGQGGYFSSRIKGDLWYSVIYGVYPDYSSAKLAAEGLPGALRRLKPWIRKVESVQTQMLR